MIVPQRRLVTQNVGPWGMVQKDANLGNTFSSFLRWGGVSDLQHELQHKRLPKWRPHLNHAAKGGVAGAFLPLSSNRFSAR
jgi:hypothetical protein